LTEKTVSSALVPAVVLVAILWLSVVSDVRTRKIPNALIVGALVPAAVWQAFGPAGEWAFDPGQPGAVGLVYACASFLVVLAVHFPLFAFGAMGAGDVKLIAVVAAIVGASPDAWSHLVGLSLSIFVAGGVLAVVWRSAWRLAPVRDSTATQTFPSSVVVAATAPSCRFDGLPFSIAIALGTAVYTTGKSMGLIEFL